MRQSFLLPLALILCLQPACIWKLWTKPPIEKRVFDVSGTVKSINKVQIVITTRKGEQSFDMDDASIRGSDFGPGAEVHVYYKLRGKRRVVTMVVEKVH